MHSLHHTTPRGTHSAGAEYKTAAESPEGETSTARSRRLEAEAARRYRARKDVAANIDEQQAAEAAAAAAELVRIDLRKSKLQAMKDRYFMNSRRFNNKEVAWEEMPESCRVAARRFGFERGCWNKLGSEPDLVCPLIRREYFEAFEELPASLRPAAYALGYRSSVEWNLEEFGTGAKRCCWRWEVGDRDPDRDVYRGVAERPWQREYGSDSELVPGHDAINGVDGMVISRAYDTMDLLAEPGRRSFCQGQYAAYRPQGGFYISNRELPSREEVFDLIDYASMFGMREEWSYNLRAL